MDTTTNKVPAFASVMLLVMGIFNLINGYVLVERVNFIEDSFFVMSNADTWGWLLLIWGVLQLVASLRLLSAGKGRVLATILGTVSMVLWFGLLFAMPFAALIGTAVNFSIVASVLSTDEG